MTLTADHAMQLHVQACRRANVPLDHLLARLHLCEKGRVAHYPCGILDLPARLVQARNHPDNGSFKHIREVRDPVEAHTSGPLVDHLDQAKPRAADKVVGVFR